MDVIIREEEDDEEKQQELISSSTIPTSTISSYHSSSSSSSTVILRDHAEAIRTRRQCHSSISLLQHQQRHPSLSFIDSKNHFMIVNNNQHHQINPIEIVI